MSVDILPMAACIQTDWVKGEDTNTYISVKLLLHCYCGSVSNFFDFVLWFNSVCILSPEQET